MTRKEDMFESLTGLDEAVLREIIAKLYSRKFFYRKDVEAALDVIFKRKGPKEGKWKD